MQTDFDQHTDSTTGRKSIQVMAPYLVQTSSVDSCENDNILIVERSPSNVDQTPGFRSREASAEDGSNGQGNIEQ